MRSAPVTVLLFAPCPLCPSLRGSALASPVPHDVRPGLRLATRALLFFCWPPCVRTLFITCIPSVSMPFLSFLDQSPTPSSAASAQRRAVSLVCASPALFVLCCLACFLFSWLSWFSFTLLSLFPRMSCWAPVALAISGWSHLGPGCDSPARTQPSGLHSTAYSLLAMSGQLLASVTVSRR